MPFHRLHPDLKHHIVNSLGWQSLRQVQELSIGPVLDGANAVILAPTAGGKTEAAFFPLISKMLTENWDGLSMLYLSPIKALLNNQYERLEKLFGLVGYRVGVWHGDISESKKKIMRADPPHILLTTPESLEGMLISTRLARSRFFGNLQAVVIDEVHAFAGDDRGWHLLGVLQRLSAYAGRDLQRLGLSATVGNPEEISRWLGSGSRRRAELIDPPDRVPRQREVKLDWVVTLESAAKVIALLHPGQRRLVFCDSRIQTEKLARALRARRVTTHLSHSSLSADERRQTEQAFAGVIVATSALELGIDIGSLDRVIQIDAPYSVASFLQRMGRTGRRPGTTANMLLLAITDPGLIRAAAILDMWKNGEVEPARQPSSPHHILAQQIMALVLERPGLTAGELGELLTPFCEATAIDREATAELLRHLLNQGYLFLDGARVGIGRAGESELGRRNFLELVSVFTTPPVFKVMANRKEIGQVHQSTFLNDERSEEATNHDKRPLVILLAGRSWRVEQIDWVRRVAHVAPYDRAGRTRWMSLGQPMTPMLARAHLRVLTGSERAAAHWSSRARTALEGLRMGYGFLDGTQPSLLRGTSESELWNFAGGQTNQYLAACLPGLGIDVASTNAMRLSLDERYTSTELEDALNTVRTEQIEPTLRRDHPMLRGLKFSELLPERLLQEAGRARVFGASPWQSVESRLSAVEHDEE